MSYEKTSLRKLLGIGTLLGAAQYAQNQSLPSPYLASSDFDRAYNAGLWAQEHSVCISEYRQSRGYKVVINDNITLDFKMSDIEPTPIN